MRINDPIRLVMFTDSLEPSGVGRVMETLARSLPRDRYLLFLACAAHPGADELARRMKPWVAETARFTVREDEEDLRALQGLVQQLTTWQADIFHNHIGATWEGAWGTLAARCAGIPLVVATEHLPNVLRARHELEHRRRMNALLDRIYTVSESVRQSQIRFGLAPPEKIVTVENGVESCDRGLSRAEARDAIRVPGVTPSAHVVLFLGRLVEQKEPATLIRAARLLQDSGESAITLLAGDGPLRPELERLAASLGVAGQVRFLGRRGDVDRLLAAADVLAVPSRFEGLPLSVLEAMSVGLPVVGCEAPGVIDAVQHRVNGWLAPIGDAEELARGLLLALQEPTGRRWREASRSRFLERFTARAMAERHDFQYRSALQELSERKGAPEARPTPVPAAPLPPTGAGQREFRGSLGA